MSTESLFDLSDGWGDPARERGEQSASWLHVPAQGELDLVMVNPVPTRYRGHWIGGKMVACRQKSCVWCDRRVGSQVRYVFRVVVVLTGQALWFETGASTAEDIRVQMTGDSLRGVRFVVWKQDGKVRGRIHAKRVPGGLGSTPLPEMEDPSTVLMAMWSVLDP